MCATAMQPSPPALAPVHSSGPTRDPSLTGLATPARLSLLTIIAGLVCAGLLWLLSLVMA